MLVGVLNLWAANSFWKVQQDFFYIVDAPIHSLVTCYDGDGLIAPIFSQNNPSVVRMVLAMICYWTIIGFLLASLICLIRNGVLRDIVCDRISCWLLFFGTCGGILIGKLSFLATSKGWGVLGSLFGSLNQPVISVMIALQQRYRMLDTLAPGRQAEFMRRDAPAIYWTVVGLFLAFIYCVIRIILERMQSGLYSSDGHSPDKSRSGFPLGGVASRAFNLFMHKDGAVISADQTGGSVFSEIVQSRTWKRALLIGSLTGMAVGVLNLAANANEWPMNDWFEFLDAPLSSLLESMWGKFELNLGPERLAFYSLLAMMCYWSIIGLLLAPVYCFVRVGGIKRVRRDRACRRALIFGVGGGIFIGLLNFVAVLAGSGALADFFEFLDRPCAALVESVAYRLGVVEILAQNLVIETILDLILAITYWLIIGLFFASLFSVARVLRMKSDETPEPVPA